MDDEQSAAYAQRRRAILKAAARIYAERGSAAISLDPLSINMGHVHNYVRRYFPIKAELVFALLNEHLGDLLTALGRADDVALDPRARLDALAAAYLEHALGEGADAHRAFRQMLHWVLPEARLDLVARERWLTALFADALTAAVPGLAADPALAAPLVLSLFAMLNGALHWLREAGPLSRADYAALAVSAIVAAAEAPPRVRGTTSDGFAMF